MFGFLSHTPPFILTQHATYLWGVVFDMKEKIFDLIEEMLLDRMDVYGIYDKLGGR